MDEEKGLLRRFLIWKHLSYIRKTPQKKRPKPLFTQRNFDYSISVMKTLRDFGFPSLSIVQNLPLIIQ